MEAWVQDLKESHQNEKLACWRKFLSLRKTRLATPTTGAIVDGVESEDPISTEHEASLDQGSGLGNSTTRMGIDHNG